MVWTEKWVLMTKRVLVNKERASASNKCYWYKECTITVVFRNAKQVMKREAIYTGVVLVV